MLLHVRVRLALVGILLCLALGTTVLAASSTYKAFQRFQQQNALATVGDVRVIQPWMTIPYVAHIYHVPTSYLCRWLHIPDNGPDHHATLDVLSQIYHKPVNTLVSQLQQAVKTYRREHPAPSPAPAHHLATWASTGSSTVVFHREESSQ